jgi:hypothetical protein
VQHTSTSSMSSGSTTCLFYRDLGARWQHDDSRWRPKSEFERKASDTGFARCAPLPICPDWNVERGAGNAVACMRRNQHVLALSEAAVAKQAALAAALAAVLAAALAAFEPAAFEHAALARSRPRLDHPRRLLIASTVHCDSGPRAWGTGERARCVNVNTTDATTGATALLLYCY